MLDRAELARCFYLLCSTPGLSPPHFTCPLSLVLLSQVASSSQPSEQCWCGLPQPVPGAHLCFPPPAHQQWARLLYLHSPLTLTLIFAREGYLQVRVSMQEWLPVLAFSFSELLVSFSSLKVAVFLLLICRSLLCILDVSTMSFFGSSCISFWFIIAVWLCVARG